MQTYAIQNNGREIVATDYWSTPNGATATAYSINAGALRVLLAANLAQSCADIATGRIAVLSIGTDKRVWRTRAGIMFDDDSDSPFCLETDLEAFDRLPDASADSRRDLECIVYAPGLRVVARMPLRIRHTKCPDYRRVED